MFGIQIDKKRIYGLDLLRAFAIFCVVDGHASHLLSGTRLEFINKIPLPHGVDIFFVISGFLIGLSFLSYADKNHGVNIGKTLRFYARTALRILPNYYIIMLIYCILISNGIINGNMQVFPLWKFFTFTQNLVKPFMISIGSHGRSLCSGGFISYSHYCWYYSLRCPLVLRK